VGETEVHEKLGRVLVRYEGGKIEPLEFRWGAREFRVQSVNARWVDRATRPVKYFFSVTAAGGEVCVLSYREGEPVWYVESVIVT
jgi:hypothetical protein